MKKYIFFFSFLITFLVGCETDGDEEDYSYVELKTDFKPQELANKYQVLFNGKDDKLIPKSEVMGKLEVLLKEDNTTVLVEDNITITNDVLTFIQPLGKELAIYSEDKYVTFNPTVIFSTDASQYSIRFKENEMTLAKDNYIAIDDLPGDITIVDKNTPQSPLFTQTLTKGSGNKLNIMQLSKTDFLGIEENNEPEPATGFCKVRFLYTQDAFPNYPELTLVVYLATTNYNKISDPIATITLKAGKLSEYVTVDNNFFGKGKVGGVFDLVDPNNADNYIVNNEKHTKTSFQFERCVNYKFMTFRFTDSSHTGGNNVKTAYIDALCTPLVTTVY